MKHNQAQIKDKMAGVERKQNEIKVGEIFFNSLQVFLFLYLYNVL